MKSELKLQNAKYDFDDAKEFEGKTFVSIHKESKYKEQVKHQNLTCSVKDWPQVAVWLSKCVEGVEYKPGEEDTSF